MKCVLTTYFLVIFHLVPNDLFAQACINLPQINGTPGTFVSPVNWSIWNSSPDLISGNGSYPSTVSAFITNVNGLSLAGGEMAFFLINGVLGPNTEGITTQLTGLVPGSTYFVSVQWQQSTLDYVGVSTDPSGGRLGMYLDGVLYQIFDSSGGVDDYWQTATMIFVASSTNHLLGLKGELLDGSNRGAIVIDDLPCSIILGFDILNFQAISNDNSSVDLFWDISEDASFDFLEIERSADLVNWTSIANSNHNSDFAKFDRFFVDENPLSGLSYYRLKEFDFDGKYYYSEIQSVEMKLKSTFNIIIFPNPGSESIIVSGANSSLIVISDLSGRIIDHSDLILSESEKSVQIDISSLSKGAYFIDASTSTQIFVKE